LAMYVANRLIVPITKEINQGMFGNLDVYFPGVVKNYEGEIWCVPHRISVNTNAYNTRRIEEVGLDSRKLPVTWDEFIAMSMRLTAPEKPGAYLAINKTNIYTWFAQALWQAGGDLFDANGKVAVNTAAGLTALHFYTDAFERGYARASTASTDMNRLASGEAGIMTHRSPVHFTDWRSNGVDWIEPGPVLQKQNRAGFGSIAGWVVTSGKNQELAKKLLAVSLRPEHVVTFLREANMFPVRRDIGISYFTPESRLWSQAFLNEVPYMRDQHLHVDIADIRSIVATALVPAIESKMAPTAALAEADRLANAFLDSRK
jgi:ABC-type glycerol-3-phosphate transport system substrate-binding protein